MNTLYTSDNEQTYMVTATPNLPILYSLGIFEGSFLTKKNTYKGGGPALVLVESREVAVGKDIALHIQVERIGGEIV
ncbi:MAG: FeoA family protein [Eubacteriales bacterium]